MTDGPRVVGINRTQDGSVALASGGDVIVLQKERITRRKHHWGRLGDLRDLYAPRMPFRQAPIDLVVECFSSDTEVEQVRAYHEELGAALPLAPDSRIVQISHHLAHVYSAFHPSPFDQASVMVIDAQGSRVRDFTEAFPGGADADPELLEISSFYHAERGGPIRCLGKQLWDGDWDNPVGLGCFYYLLTRMIFPHGEGNEGKVMGLASFGRPGSMDLPPLDVDEYRVTIPAEWIKLLGEREHFLWGQDREGAFQDSADLAAEGQAAFEEALLRVTRWLHAQTGDGALCFAGGTALNCSANGRLVRESPFDELFIPPSPHDGGTALGCALYGMLECLGQPDTFRWTNDFLGPEPSAAEVEGAVRSVGPDLIVERPDDLVGRMVELLASGRVVSIRHGRSESGPRALGNRSIIADARRPGMQDYINFEVKGREWFRPLAPLVLADAAPRIFDVDRPAPFMQYAADVRPEHREALPAITHVDGTARLQTVEATQTPFLHAVLSRFEAETGCPVLLNTSLNGKGDPLVETAEEALACLSTTGMHALVMPPYLVRKRDEPPVVDG